MIPNDSGFLSTAHLIAIRRPGVSAGPVPRGRNFLSVVIPQAIATRNYEDL
jgi:hypothetical protein